MKTMDDLKAAFAGESQANRRYTAYARQADAEGYPHVAKLFRAVAAAETVHALNHFKALGEIKSTEENLKAAMAGENYEVVTMYPEFIADAEEEDEKKALRTFNYAWEVEKIHEQLYQQALDSLAQVPDENLDYWVCSVCGYTVQGEAPPDVCPVCKAKGTKFERIV